MANSADVLIFQLHGSLLRGLSASSGLDFAGLEQAGRTLRFKKLIDNNSAKKLAQLDHAFNWTRHITATKADMFQQKILAAVASSAKSPTPPTSSAADAALVSLEAAEEACRQALVEVPTASDEVVRNAPSGSLQGHAFDGIENIRNSPVASAAYDIEEIKNMAGEHTDGFFKMLRGSVNGWPPIIDGNSAEDSKRMVEEMVTSHVLALLPKGFPSELHAPVRSRIAERSKSGFEAWERFFAMNRRQASSSTDDADPPRVKRVRFKGGSSR